MKISQVVALSMSLTASTVAAFSAVPSMSLTTTRSLTRQYMFGGAGEGSPAEDDDEQKKQMEKAAAAFGMSVEEYKLATNARLQLQKTMDETMVTGGKKETVLIERDINNPPKNLDVTVTEAGKALGQEALSKEVVAALKKASEASKLGRQEAQKEMMKFIQAGAPKK